MPADEETAKPPRTETPREVRRVQRKEGVLPVAPSMDAAMASVRAPQPTPSVTPRVLWVSVLAMLIALAAGLIAQFLMALIGLVTNVSFFGNFSTAFNSPGATHLGLWIIPIPVIGAIIVGIMARYGSPAIRGHGIPEVMEKVLYGASRIPVRVMFLKPLSAAIAIGTGGPFGAEGPIIATGGALGSVVGQVLHVTADERKILLAAGAAAGMAATFGSPVSAVLLAVELLLFEYRPRSLVPVALASAVATAVRMAFDGSAPIFAMGTIAQPTGSAMVAYVVLGALIGVIAVGITRITYGIEDAFEHLPVHWMWYPAIGAVVVGVVGVIEPRTLGVGYSNITAALTGSIAGKALLVLVILKFISWAVYLGSGTSGGTLAPLFTIGGGLGALAGTAAAALFPSIGVDPHVAGLVGMAAIFAGASHALLASVIFAFETTRQPLGLLPLLAGCSAAYLIAQLLNRTSIMTEKLARRGAPVRTEYTADYLGQLLVRDVASRDVASLRASDTLAEARAWLTSGAKGSRHQGFPILNADGLLLGVLTRRDLLDHTHDTARTLGELVHRPPIVVFEDHTLRDAADHMVIEHVGRLPVVTRDQPRVVVGMLTRSDLLSAHQGRLEAAMRRTRSRRRRRRSATPIAVKRQPS